MLTSVGVRERGMQAEEKEGRRKKDSERETEKWEEREREEIIESKWRTQNHLLHKRFKSKI